MLHQIIVVERLLEHHESQPVKPGQVGGIGRLVGRIGIGHERHLPEARPESLERRGVPAGLDFDLDPPVAVGQLGRRPVDERVNRGLDADGHPGRNGPGARAEHSTERLPTLTRRQVPDGHLERGLGHLVAPDPRKARTSSRECATGAPSVAAGIRYLVRMCQAVTVVSAL